MPRVYMIGNDKTAQSSPLRFVRKFLRIARAHAPRVGGEYGMHVAIDSGIIFEFVKYVHMRIWKY